MTVERDAGKESGGEDCVRAETKAENTNGLTAYSDWQRYGHISGLDRLASRCGKAYCEWCVAFAARKAKTNMPIYES